MKFTSVKQFQRNLNKRIIENPVKHSKKIVTRSTMLVESTAKESIMKGGSGESVKRYQPNRTHTVSKPLDPPANDTGFLVSQITINVDSNPDGSVVGQIISSAPYSKALEFGTTKMTARPFMQPALEKNKRKIVSMFTKAGLIK
tara:strand:+ start:388 stop:819 length:432 start_codon:yes stop_codon:yes gene_type:complete